MAGRLILLASQRTAADTVAAFMQPDTLRPPFAARSARYAHDGDSSGGAEMEFSGSVVAITGAAGGIGLALAQEAVRRGMSVTISDIREDALDSARAQLAALGGDVLAVRADATKSADMEAMAAATVERFGKVNVLINNAGAFVASLAWETPEAQLDWIIDLNVKSIAHGFRAFVPRMIAQGDPCHVVTIASAAAITVYPGYASYSSSKHASLALTEALYLDLAAEGIANVGVTIVMPTIIRTDIMSPEKASPAALDLAAGVRFQRRTVRAMEQMMRNHVAGGGRWGQTRWRGKPSTRLRPARFMFSPDMTARRMLVRRSQ